MTYIGHFFRPGEETGPFQMPFSQLREQSIISNIQLPSPETDCSPLMSRKMWSAACRGVSPSMRETLRGSAPLVKRRKAKSKSSCLRHMRSGLSWLSWRPSGSAGMGVEWGKEAEKRSSWPWKEVESDSMREGSCWSDFQDVPPPHTPFLGP